VATNSRVKLNISLKPEYGCAVGNFSIDGIEPETIASKLFSEHQIHTVSIKWENISGVRVTPHVYTTTKDLDRFVDAVLKIAST
jgi:selenocysteine lyase/cysteine desulfurase